MTSPKQEAPYVPSFVQLDDKWEAEQEQERAELAARPHPGGWLGKTALGFVAWGGAYVLAKLLIGVIGAWFGWALMLAVPVAFVLWMVRDSFASPARLNLNEPELKPEAQTSFGAKERRPLR